MGRRLPWRVFPEETGGIGTFKAQKILTELLLRMPDLFGVTIGPWSMKLDLHRTTGVVLVKLNFSMWKTGWSPPPQPEAPPKPSKKKKPAKKASSRKPPKRAG